MMIGQIGWEKIDLIRTVKFMKAMMDVYVQTKKKKGL